MGDPRGEYKPRRCDGCGETFVTRWALYGHKATCDE